MKTIRDLFKDEPVRIVILLALGVVVLALLFFDLYGHEHTEDHHRSSTNERIVI